MKNDNQKQEEVDTENVSYRIYSSETVLFDKKGKRLMGFPTEKEAVEYVREPKKNKNQVKEEGRNLNEN